MTVGCCKSLAGHGEVAQADHQRASLQASKPFSSCEVVDRLATGARITDGSASLKFHGGFMEFWMPQVTRRRMSRFTRS